MNPADVTFIPLAISGAHERKNAAAAKGLRQILP
jgi:hypothetical protein